MNEQPAYNKCLSFDHNPNVKIMEISSHSTCYRIKKQKFQHELKISDMYPTLASCRDTFSGFDEVKSFVKI